MKQVAQQEAEKARYLVEKAEQMKLAAVTTAEGDAQASKLLSKAFGEAGDGLIELRKLEAAEEIAELLAKSKNVAYLPKVTFISWVVFVVGSCRIDFVMRYLFDEFMRTLPTSKTTQTQSFQDLNALLALPQ